MLEDEAVRRAKDGVRRPLVYKGKQVYIQGEPIYQIEYSDHLVIRLLEANAPDKWKPRTENKNINEWDLSKLSSEQLEMLAHQWILQATGNDPALAEQTRRELESKVRVIECKVETGSSLAQSSSTPSQRRFRRDRHRALARSSLRRRVKPDSAVPTKRLVSKVVKIGGEDTFDTAFADMEAPAVHSTQESRPNNRFQP